MKKLVYVAFVAMLFITVSVGAVQNTPAQKESKSQKEIAALRAQIKTLTAGNAQVAQYLQKFDTLDFTVFSNQQWVRLHESHAKNIKVNWPDGHYTMGIERHIADLSAMFVYAPDTKIKIHPVRFGSGNMTCVTGVMTVHLRFQCLSEEENLFNLPEKRSVFQCVPLVSGKMAL